MQKLRWLMIIGLCLLLGNSLALAQDETGTHVVQSGENLFRIALRYGVDMTELATANGIQDLTQIYAGQVLTIPGLEAVNESDDIANPLVAAAPIIHTVQSGEYIGQIAALYDLTIDDILSANNIADPDTVYAGQELQIWSSALSVAPTPDVTETETAEAEVAEAEAAPTVQEQVIHIVQPGEYLSSIARSYGVPWTAIAEANNIVDPNDVNYGTALVIPGASNSVTNGDVVNTVRTISQNLPDPGAHWGVGREIVVDLSTQMTYAYENGELVFSALVSTGLPATPTVQGEYSIWHRTPAQTMSGPGYSLPNVQWVMYFYQGYGFHGTYWHNNFGSPMSHGCVNMTNEDAQWLYNFASIGTNVFVQY
ncbi:MAG: LysM peptidoglycan-binding domain-containing protein [Chloroflexota bacterium]